MVLGGPIKVSRGDKVQIGSTQVAGSQWENSLVVQVGSGIGRQVPAGRATRSWITVTSPPLPGQWQEGIVFRTLRRRIFRTLVIQTIRHSLFQLVIMGLLSVCLWIALFALARDGFVFLKNTIPADLLAEVIEIIFGVFFVTLMVMLAFFLRHFAFWKLVSHPRRGTVFNPTCSAGADLPVQVS